MSRTSVSLADSGVEPTHVAVRPGDVLEGKWRLERKLGEGGMGTVYLAHDLQLDRKVAIKLLAPALAHDAELVSRFEREARLTAGLEHPNVVPVYAVGRLEQRPFMVMKALEGKTLGLWLRERGTLRKEEVVPLFRQLAAGLDFIHARGFIHRDIKAGNIYVGSNGHATLLDFGIVRPSRGAEQLTRTGMVMGTPQYMSPEQAMGFRDIDHRSDLYALATLLFECLAGSLPFEADNDLSIIQMQAHTPPPDLAERAPWVPRAVSDVLARALAKSAEERYPTANALVDALEEAYGDRPAGSATSSGPLSLSSFPLPPPPAGRSGPKQPPNAPGRSGPKDRPSLPVVIGAPLTDSGRVLAAPEQAIGAESDSPEGSAGPRSRRLPLWVGGAVALLAAAAAVVWSVRPSGEPEERLAPPVAMAVPITVADAGAVSSVAVERDAGASVAEDEGEPDAGAVDAEALTAELPVRQSEGAAAAADAGTRRRSRTTTRAAVGKLNVITTHRGEPYWAKVLVDGEKKGTTPMLLELPAGKHQVRVERVGFRPVVKQIKIAPGRPAVVRIELLP